MLKSTLLSTLVLVSSTLARPAEVLDEARAAVILNILKEADKNGQDVALVARQLFGGNDEYAPYEIPCPDGFTWVRPADVSLKLARQRAPADSIELGYRRAEFLGAETPSRRRGISKDDGCKWTQSAT